LKVMQDAARATPPDRDKRFIEDMLRAANAGGVAAGSSEAAARAREQ
jgi:hypothetical protein